MQRVTTMKVTLPLDIAYAVRSFPVAEKSDEERLKRVLATGLFVERAITLAKAARLAGMHRYEFAMFLKNLGIPAYEYTGIEYEQDQEFIRRYQEQSGEKAESDI